ncbi:MAG: hypothetical protein WAN43_09870 [Rhodomicrobium sp.]
MFCSTDAGCAPKTAHAAPAHCSIGTFEPERVSRHGAASSSPRKRICAFTVTSETPYVGALTPTHAKDTDLANEAWHLAFRNAFIVLDGSSEAAHRTYGCLYGVEMYGGSNPLAVVPSAVSTVSAAQKLFSALMIFLFGLALRNMLKVKRRRWRHPAACSASVSTPARRMYTSSYIANQYRAF